MHLYVLCGAPLAALPLLLCALLWLCSVGPHVCLGMSLFFTTLLQCKLLVKWFAAMWFPLSALFLLCSVGPHVCPGMSLFSTTVLKKTTIKLICCSAVAGSALCLLQCGSACVPRHEPLLHYIAAV
jgi:hypothetical protein